MLPVVVVALLTVTVGHGLLAVLVHLSTPLLALDWLGWSLVALLVWVFAGAG